MPEMSSQVGSTPHQTLRSYTDLSFSFPYVPPLIPSSVLAPYLFSVDGSELKGERLTVQFARGPRRKDDFGPQERQAPRPRRTIYRMQITGLQSDTSWQVSKNKSRIILQ